jgi:hypothetical protein
VSISAQRAVLQFLQPGRPMCFLRPFPNLLASWSRRSYCARTASVARVSTRRPSAWSLRSLLASRTTAPSRASATTRWRSLRPLRSSFSRHVRSVSRDCSASAISRRCSPASASRRRAGSGCRWGRFPAPTGRGGADRSGMCPPPGQSGSAGPYQQPDDFSASQLGQEPAPESVYRYFGSSVELMGQGPGAAGRASRWAGLGPLTGSLLGWARFSGGSGQERGVGEGGIVVPVG